MRRGERTDLDLVGETVERHLELAVVPRDDAAAAEVAVDSEAADLVLQRVAQLLPRLRTTEGNVSGQHRPYVCGPRTTSADDGPCQQGPRTMLADHRPRQRGPRTMSARTTNNVSRDYGLCQRGPRTVTTYRKSADHGPYICGPWIMDHTSGSCQRTTDHVNGPWTVQK